MGACGQYVDESGELIVRDFDYVKQIIADKIDEICRVVEADAPPTLYLTSDPKLMKDINRSRKFLGKEVIPFKENFRFAVAKTKPYKGTRKQDKPVHYNNIRSFLISEYHCKVANGIEADDAMAIDQGADTVICSLDKDLRMVPGYHFGWARGDIPESPLELITDPGYLTNDGKKVKGGGLLFFYYQMLVGDTVDNIPGCPKIGPIKALKILEGCDTNEKARAAVKAQYELSYPEDYAERYIEMGQLLWIKRQPTTLGEVIDCGEAKWP